MRLTWLETIWLDLRYAARSLRKSPAFTTVALLSLALGIGANAALFQLLDVVRLRSLPVSNPDEIVEIRMPPGTGNVGMSQGSRPMLTNPIWEQISGSAAVAHDSVCLWRRRIRAGDRRRITGRARRLCQRHVLPGA